jgi:hypothetical protein
MGMVALLKIEHVRSQVSTEYLAGAPISTEKSKATAMQSAILDLPAEHTLVFGWCQGQMHVQAQASRLKELESECF